MNPNTSGHWAGRVGEEIDRREVHALSRCQKAACATCLPREEGQKTILAGAADAEAMDSSLGAFGNSQNVFRAVNLFQSRTQ